MPAESVGIFPAGPNRGTYPHVAEMPVKQCIERSGSEQTANRNHRSRLRTSLSNRLALQTGYQRRLQFAADVSGLRILQL